MRLVCRRFAPRRVSAPGASSSVQNGALAAAGSPAVPLPPALGPVQVLGGAPAGVRGSRVLVTYPAPTKTRGMVAVAVVVVKVEVVAVVTVGCWRSDPRTAFAQHASCVVRGWGWCLGAIHIIIGVGKLVCLQWRGIRVAPNVMWCDVIEYCSVRRWLCIIEPEAAWSSSQGLNQ